MVAPCRPNRMVALGGVELERYRFAVTEPLSVTSSRVAAKTAVSAAPRLCFALALVAVVGTYVAAQVDFWRRHKPGIAPEIYLGPQFLQVWLPGILLTAILVLAGFVLHRRQDRAVVLPSGAQSE